MNIIPFPSHIITAMKRSICCASTRCMLITTCLTILFLCTPLIAQEVQIPFDEAGKIFVVTADLEKDLRLFVEYENFVEARLYKLLDSSFVLEITQTTQGKMIRTRKALVQADVEIIRTRLAAIMASTPQMNPDEQLTGWERTSQVIGSGMLGLVYGLFADEASTPYYRYSRNETVAPWVLLTPLAYAGATIYAINQPWFGRSASTMLTHGMVSGFVHGALLYGAIAEEKKFESETMWGIGITAGLIQGIATMRLPEKWGFNFGQTSVFTNMSVSGTIAGFLAPGMFGAFDGSGWTSQAFCATALGFSAAGYWLGYELSHNQHYAGGDASVFTIPASIGLVLPPAFVLAAEPSLDDGKILVGTMLAAHIAGYFIGNGLIKEKDFSFEQGRLISTAAWLGTLPGLFTLYAARNNSLAKISPLLSVLGAGIGFTIAYNNNREEARQNHNKRRAGGGVGYSKPEGGSWWKTFVRNSDFQASPLGLLGLINPDVGGVGVSLPFLRYRYTFGNQEKKLVVPLEENVQYHNDREKKLPENE